MTRREKLLAYLNDPAATEAEKASAHNLLARLTPEPTRPIAQAEPYHTTIINVETVSFFQWAGVVDA